MMAFDCVLGHDDRCIYCGWQWKPGTGRLRNCDNPPDLRPAADKLKLPDPIPAGMTPMVARFAAGELLGPGDWLHIIILRRFGEGPTLECDCTNRINLMNAWGTAGCREHLDEIVGWLVEQAKEHKWVATTTDAKGDEVVIEVPPPMLARFGRWLAKGTHRHVILKVVCRRMVLAAIKQAEQPHNDSIVKPPDEPTTDIQGTVV